MHRYALCLLLVALAAAGQNPVTNGGFETLGGDGFPVDWEQVGFEAKVVPEAHSGKNAMLLHRPEDADQKRHETGLNREWEPDSGKQGAMLDVAKGGLRFWYKVLQADPSVVMKMSFIPMTDRPYEGCGAPRAFYQVPRKHFGDGEWHQGVLAFDYSTNRLFKWLHIGPRVTGPGETKWLLDDIEYVESVGPLPTILSLEPYEMIDGATQLRCVMTNAGDAPLKQGSVTLSLPGSLQLADAPATHPVRELAPDTFEVVPWKLKGTPKPGDVATVQFSASGKTVEVTHTFKPELDWIQFQTERNVLWPGQQIGVDVVAYNRGDAVLPQVDLDITLPGELKAMSPLPEVLRHVSPGGKAKVTFYVRAMAMTEMKVMRCRWQIPDGRDGDFAAEMTVGQNPDEADKPWMTVGCDSFEIVFPRNDFGSGPGWVYAKGPERRLVGVIPNLGRLVTPNTGTRGVVLTARDVRTLRDGEAIGAKGGSGLRFSIEPRLLAEAAVPGPMFVDIVAAKDAKGATGKLITCRITAPAPKEGTLLALDGPQLTTLVGGKDEALAPGMEWLVGDEDSSNDNVIIWSHPHRLRWRAHPHLVTVPMLGVRRKDVVTAVFWHPRATWNDGTPRPDLTPGESDTDRPTPVFATPDRFGGHACAVMGLSVPSVGTYAERNTIGTGKGWPAAGVNATKIDLSYAFYVNTGADSVLDALQAWFDVYGVAIPRMPPQVKDQPKLQPTVGYRGNGLPLWAQAAQPNGAWPGITAKQWVDEMEWSMQAYLWTLWKPETKEWDIFHGGPPVKRREGVYPHYLFDCATTAALTDDRELRQKLETLVNEVKTAHNNPIPVAMDQGMLYGNPIAQLVTKANQAVTHLRSQDPDGGWRYKTRIEQGGTFKGRDYAGLAPDGFEGNGLVARKAYELLRTYNLTGDARVLAGGLKALDYMEKFRVPRAAQVWEVVGHAPDILAAADACQAYIEAYRATGDKKWLAKAKYWAWAGMPFVYQWGVDGYPWLRYGSIPIFGATWWRGGWFANPVQWNGLRFAYAISELAEYDDSFPWLTVANGLTVSALYMQGTDPKNQMNYALWPDVYNAISGRRVEWNFAPHGFLINIHKLMGREPYPVVERLRDSKGKQTPIRVIGCVRFVRGHDSYVTKSRTVTTLFETGYPLSGRIVVAGVTEPESVGRLRRVDDNPTEPGTWCYDAGIRAVVAFPIPDYKTELNIVGVDPVEPGFTPGEKTDVNFKFAATTEGWRRMNDISAFDIRSGNLHVVADKGDPYMVRSFCQIDGNTINRVRVRLAATAGDGAQFFWTTEDGTNMSPQRQLNTVMVGDGQFHEIVFPVGEHPQWKGKTITSIRLDPMSGADKATIDIDWIRGEK